MFHAHWCHGPAALGNPSRFTHRPSVRVSLSNEILNSQRVNCDILRLLNCQCYRYRLVAIQMLHGDADSIADSPMNNVFCSALELERLQSVIQCHCGVGIYKHWRNLFSGVVTAWVTCFRHPNQR